ncbi:MAG: AAA family ATPase [Patulibacter minatonensis]
MTSFVGRDADLARLQELLARHRLVTLIGPGGAGKTRLASEAAAQEAERSTGGVWLVELASVTDPTDLAGSVLGALGVREARLVPGPGLTPAATDDVGEPLDHLVDMLAPRDAPSSCSTTAST